MKVSANLKSITYEDFVLDKCPYVVDSTYRNFSLRHTPSGQLASRAMFMASRDRSASSFAKVGPSKRPTEGDFDQLKLYLIERAGPRTFTRVFTEAEQSANGTRRFRIQGCAPSRQAFALTQLRANAAARFSFNSA